jgi:hypothetical protein
VTTERVVPQIVDALRLAIERGLQPPVVYNKSAHDSADSPCADGPSDYKSASGPSHKCRNRRQRH